MILHKNKPRPEWAASGACGGFKLQALVYDILPSTTAAVDYVIGLEKTQLTNSFSMTLQRQ